jgi:hypothetical protein
MIMWQNIWLKMLGVSKTVWNFIFPFIKIFLSDIGPILIQAATAAVAQAATMPGATGEDKRNAAINSVISTLETQGIKIGLQVTTSMINAAIEAAVQAMKDAEAKKAETTATATT